VPLYTAVVSVAGDMQDPVKEQVRVEAGKAIDSYFTNAFLAGPAGQAQAFAAFTPAAAAQAAAMTEVMTSGSLAPSLTGVRAATFQAGLSLWAHDGAPQGATAQIELSVEAKHSTDGLIDFVVTGTLDLLPTPEGWKIFGFNLTNALSQLDTGTSSTTTARS
jgi:hypothetical protein